MQPDPEYLRRHYALLSDEALLEMDRADLVEVAQQLYDHEIARRGLAPVEVEADEHLPPRISKAPAEEPGLAHEPHAWGQPADQPDWHEEASDVFFRAPSEPGLRPRLKSTLLAVFWTPPAFRAIWM